MGVEPDYSLERDGVGLAEWLWRLVGEDPQVRRLAGDTLKAMLMGIPSPQTKLDDMELPWDARGQSRRFDQAVREAVSSPGFDTGEFVRQLCAYRVALKADSLQRVLQSYDEKEPTEQAFERVLRRLAKRMDEGPDEANVQKMRERMSRVLDAVLRREVEIDNRVMRPAETSAEADMMSFHILRLLGAEFIQAPEALMLLLEDPHQRSDALEAIIRIGPEARMFWPRLCELLDHLSEGHISGRSGVLPQAIAAIGPGDADVVDALAERLNHEHHAVRSAAAGALSHMGGDVAGRADAIVPRLLELLGSREGYRWAVVAAASVGRGMPHVRAKVLELARSRPPQWETHPQMKSYRYDKAMCDRGAALDALVHLSDYPQECLPVLMAALDDFEEPDSDWEYFGPVARVAHILKEFGPAAAPAAGALASRLENLEDACGWPLAIVDALKAMGPAAGVALPALRRLYERERDDPREEDVAEAIRAVTGRDDMQF